MASRKGRKRRKSRKTKALSVQSGTKSTASLQDASHKSGARDGPAEIRRLISQGKYKLAVNKAKQYHKLAGTKESEAILADAYVVRIRGLIDSGHTADAKALIKVVAEKHPSVGQVLADLNTVICVREGKIEELVRPLCEPDIAEQRRKVIEKIIKEELIDLDALAQCSLLSSEHPLRAAAAAVAEAFSAVTSGPVEDEAITLPEISRRSPFSPWKILIRAIACFYRRDDDTCKRFLQAIDPKSAPARLIPVIRAMIADGSSYKLKGKSSLLVSTISGDRSKLCQSLQVLDSALGAQHHVKTLKAIRHSVNTCKEVYPELVDKLRQHIFIRAWMNDLPEERVHNAMGGPSLKDAYFWQLHARAAELTDRPVLACSLWHKFLNCAVEEGWFARKGIETSVVYFHMADLLRRVPEDELEWERQELMMFGDTGVESATYFLYPDYLYRMASEIDPAPEIFQKWLEWAENSDLGWREQDRVAMEWHAALPDDVRPLLYLMESGEKRNALKKALGYLEKAEQIEGLNPDVRRARLRLLVATAIRHLKQKKTHLARKDFQEIERLPQAHESDRPAFLAALRCACAMIDRQDSELATWNEELIRLLEDRVAASVVMEGVLKACRFSEDLLFSGLSVPDSVPGDALVAGVARGCAIGDDVGLQFGIPLEWEKGLIEFFSGQNSSSVEVSVIRTIANAALKNENLELAYAASGAGLLRGGSYLGRFLLLRALSLPAWEMDRRNECIAAAAELARRQRDIDLLDEAIELRRQEGGFFLWETMIEKSDFCLDQEELDRVIEREKKARKYPSTFSDYSDSDYSDNDWYNYYNDDEDFEDEDFYDDIPFDLPPEVSPKVLPLLFELFIKHSEPDGRVPKIKEIARKDSDLVKQLIDVMFEDDQAKGRLPEFVTQWLANSKRSSRKSKKKGRTRKR
ncbi:MAG: hypothetical protein JRI58_01285 [Deltaproteobacteria bacterium]|nr:hypothetical protein [Deltaproteobacteria bacterium]MBW2073372.1 hypothetical protein [Deltaproteobacteria bacterium]RLB83231.1 MAG: hypothetical protein DRH17_03235 [Deltaproteobacteria bacterium]